MKPSKPTRKLTDPAPPKRVMFSSKLRLSEIAGSIVELTCPECHHRGLISATDLMKAHGGGAALIAQVLAKSSCTACGRGGVPAITVHPPRSQTDEADQ